MTTPKDFPLPLDTDKKDWPWIADPSFLSSGVVGEVALPRITIITPSLNKGQFIEETIRSILLQGYPNLEYIIIDGGSTDNTHEVIRKYEKFITYWTSERDNGQSDAINKGVERATGDIVGWLNADDVYYPNAFSSMAKAFIRYNDADLIYGTGCKISEDGKVIKKIGFRPFDEKRMRRAFYFLQPTMFFKKSAFVRVGGLRVTCKYAMDWELLLKMMSFARIYAIEDRIAMLRIYPGALTAVVSWAMCRELAEITRTHNGVFNLNNISFHVRQIVGRMKSDFAVKKIRPLVDMIISRMCGPYEIPINRIWPKPEDF